jgi:hypothetical protein
LCFYHLNPTGRDKNGYYHELFLRGKSFLVRKINRIKIKGEGGRKPSSPQCEPNFYSIATMPPAEKVQRIEADTEETAAAPHVVRMESIWPAAPRLGTSALSYPFLPSSLTSLTASVPVLRSEPQMSNLALDLALARILPPRPPPTASLMTTALTKALLGKLSLHAAALHSDALLRQEMDAPRFTSYLPNNLLRTPGSEVIPGADEDRIAMLLKNYYS